MEARGLGELKKMEDRYMSSKEISEFLASVKVDENYPPMRMFVMLVAEEDSELTELGFVVRKNVLKTVTLTAYKHQDGTRDFNSPDNVEAVCKIDNIIKFLQ